MVFCLSIFVIYFIFLVVLASGLIRWRRKENSISKAVSVSVVVAMRNEAHNLPALVASLARQVYSAKWQLILVDDHSEDNTLQVAMELKGRFPGITIQIISSSGNGKKQALTSGIEGATGEIILTTDADCELPPFWINEMVTSFSGQTQLVVGKVSLNTNSTLFGKLQVVEFASIMATGLGMLGWGKPVMCNGASLAFRKAAFIEVNGYSDNEHIPSGDDEFLMRKIENRFPKSIAVVKYNSSGCRTKPTSTTTEFFEQRIRWAGKWQSNAWGLTKSTAVFVFLFQLAWLPVAVIALITLNAWLLAGVFFKIGLELLLLAYTSKLMQQEFSLPAFFLLQILYSPYVVMVAVASQLTGYRWKGRMVPAPR